MLQRLSKHSIRINTKEKRIQAFFLFVNFSILQGKSFESELHPKS